MALVAPEVPKYDNTGVENFMRGFSMVSQLSAKRQANELAVQKMVQDQELREKKFALDQVGLGLRAERYENMAEAAAGRLGVAQERLNYTKQKDQETIEAEAALAKELAGIKAPEGTAVFKAASLEAMSRHPRALSGSHGKQMLVNTAKAHSTQLKVQQSLFNEELKQLGIPYDALENPNIWQKDPKKPGKRFLEMPSQTPETDPGGNATGKFLTKYVTVEDSKFERLHSRYKDLFGDPETGRPKPRSPLDPETARKYLDKANGDKSIARQLATEDGYSF